MSHGVIAIGRPSRHDERDLGPLACEARNGEPAADPLGTLPHANQPEMSRSLALIEYLPRNPDPIVANGQAHAPTIPN